MKKFLVFFTVFLVFVIFFKNEKREPPLAGVIPHHLVAQDVIEDFFVGLKRIASPKTFVLISPDHFQRIPAPIVTGKIGIPDENILKLLQMHGVLESSSDVKKEHGITNVLHFLSKTFPNAKIVPILVGEDTKISFLDPLAETLASHTDDSVFFLASTDFSHHLPKNATLFHDLRSIGVFSTFDEKFFPNLETDLWQTLYLVRKIAFLKEANDFELLTHHNTSDYLGGLIEDNVGYVTGFLRKGDFQKSRPTNLLFFGDMMFDRDIRILLDRDTYFPFKRIHHLMLGADVVSGNLEGPLVEKRPFPFHENQFAFSPDIGDLLKSVDISLVNIANNHILDAGEEGREETMKHLGRVGIMFPPKEISLGNEKIAFLGYSPFLSDFNHNQAIEEIKTTSKRNTFTVVQMHWGKEYSQIPSDEERTLAKAMIDAGADTIIGHGPHVIQPHEIYNDKVIFYSLGNFIFDQGGDPLLEEGLSVGIVLEEDQIRYFLFPLSLKNSQPKLLPGSSKNVTFTTPRTY